MQKVTIIIIVTIAIVLFTIAVTAQERPPIDGNGSHSNVTIAPPPIVTRYAPTMTATPTALPTEQWNPTPDDVHDCPRCDMIRFVNWKAE